MSTEPLQTDELVQILQKWKVCAVVHQDSEEEVGVTDNTYHDKNLPWKVFYIHAEFLDDSIVERALTLGYELEDFLLYDKYVYELNYLCVDVRDAAIKALQLARILPGVPSDAWLWFTNPEPDGREENPPGPPSPWPPAA